MKRSATGSHESSAGYTPTSHAGTGHTPPGHTPSGHAPANGGYGAPMHSPYTTLPAGAGSAVSLFGIEPEAGMKAIENIIASAQKSLWIEMYLFDADVIARMLLKQKEIHPHLDLRLLYHQPHMPPSLDPTQSQRYPSWVQPNRGVRTDGELATIHHAKFILVDADVPGHARAYIMTANFTTQALGGNHAGYANREYILSDSDPADIALLKAIFLADQAGKPLPAIHPESNLIVSDINALHLLPLLLKSAKKSIEIQIEYLNDPDGNSHATLNLKQILLQAAAQGIAVQVMLPPLSPAVPGAPSADNYATYHALMPSVQVNVTPQYFMHAKVIIIDGHLAFVGSHNLSHQSLRYSREVGVLISDKHVVSALRSTFRSDWKQAQRH